MSIKPLAALLPLLALMLSSCVENNRETGSELITDDFRLKVKVATFDLPVTNKVSDSVQASNSSHLLVGAMTDPTYGKLHSGGASFVLPYSDSTDFGDDPRLVEAYMLLSVDSTLYTNDNQEGIPQNIYIHRLNHEIDSTMGFCNSITPEYYDAELVTETIPVIYNTGTVKIRLTDKYAQELLDTTPEEFKDIDLFMERVFGLYITTDAPADGQLGGRLNFLDLGNSSITLRYIMNDPDREIKDLDTTESFVFGYSYALNNFSTGSESLENDDPQESLYLEGLTGVKPHIRAKDVKKMLDEWMEKEGYDRGSVILSRASVKFTYEMPEDYELFDKIHPLAIYAFTNIPTATDTTRFFKPLDDVNNVVNRGYIDRSHKEYVMDITEYCQDLLNQEVSEVEESRNLWIAPLSSYVDAYNNIYFLYDNRNYSRITLNGPASEKRPTLTLTYTVMEH